MIAGTVVVLLLILLWNIPIGVEAEYSEGGATVKAKISFVRVLLYPREKKDKIEKNQVGKQPDGKKPLKTAQKKAPEKKASSEEQKPVKADSSSPSRKAPSERKEVPEQPKEKPQEEPNPPEEQKKNSPDLKALITGGDLPLFRELLGLALEAVGHIRRKLEITNLKLYLSLGGFGDDPAASAMLYAKAWTAIGALTPVLENNFSIRNRDIQASVDFADTENWVYGLAELSLKLGEILMIALYYGLRGLKILLKIKKGGKKNGTSDQ